jgi:ADP-ribosylglycohydrolase
MSSRDSSFDIGNTVKSTLASWSQYLRDEYDNLQPDSLEAEDSLESFKRRIHGTYATEKYCGNGSLMRVLPTALIARSEPEAVTLAQQSSMTTHPHLRCQHACMVYASVVYQALNGASKTELAVSLAESVDDIVNNNIAETALEPIIRERLQRYQKLQDWEDKSVDAIRSTGYVVDSLEAALWAFFKSDSFEEGAILAVNLGDDADTVGAIYGGLAGAFYGAETIPERWLQKLKRVDMLDEVIEKIHTSREKLVLT